MPMTPHPNRTWSPLAVAAAMASVAACSSSEAGSPVGGNLPRYGGSASEAAPAGDEGAGVDGAVPGEGDADVGAAGDPAAGSGVAGAAAGDTESLTVDSFAAGSGEDDSAEGGPGDGAAGDEGTGDEGTGDEGTGDEPVDTGDEPGVDTGQPIGFASLNGGTTGGAAGEIVTVTSYDELRSSAESSTPLTILVEGTISNGANGGVVRVQSNKSIIGVGSTAFLNGVGLDINNSNNVILRNLRISMTGVTTRTDANGIYSSTGDEGRPQVLVNDGDAIGIRGTSKNVWVDHCELFSEDPDVQTNKDLYDGLIDVKNQTGFITISWSHFHDHHKAGLVGSSDTDLFADRKITFHHNYYDNVKLRVPMYRGGVGHFFNNYVVGATDATEIRADTCVRVERNYYEPLHFSIYTPSDSVGRAERIDNIEVDRTSRAYPPSCTADIPYPYADALTGNTNDVPTVVPAFAGVGKI